MKVAHYTINLDRYDKLLCPPYDTKKYSITSFYITSQPEDVTSLKKLGWDYVYVEPSHKYVEHLGCNSVFLDLKIFPESVFPQLLEYDIVFFTDSNIVKLSDYFVDKYIYNVTHHTMLLENQWYDGRNNNLEAEFGRSMQPRWKMCWESFVSARKKYIKMGYNLSKIKVCSAKYIVLNMNRKLSQKPIFDFLQSEYMCHYQGNIIYGIASVKFKDEIITSDKIKGGPSGQNSLGKIILLHHARNPGPVHSDAIPLSEFSAPH